MDSIGNIDKADLAEFNKEVNEQGKDAVVAMKKDAIKAAEEYINGISTSSENKKIWMGELEKIKDDYPFWSAKKTLGVIAKFKKKIDGDLMGKKGTRDITKSFLTSEIVGWWKKTGIKGLLVSRPSRVLINVRNGDDETMSHLYYSTSYGGASHYYHPIDSYMAGDIRIELRKLAYLNGLVTNQHTIDEVVGNMATSVSATKDGLGFRETTNDQSAILYIGSSLYYDMDTGKIMDNNELGREDYAFMRLFDTADTDDPHVPKIDDSYLSEAVILDSRREMKATFRRYLSARKGEVPGKNGLTDIEALPDWMIGTFGGWADGEPDRVMDMLIVMAAILFKIPLHSAVFLVGEKANGKTTFINLIRTIFGKNRLGSVALSDIGDPHFVGSLRGCLANLSEENMATTDKRIDTSTFKVAADGGSKSVSVLYSQQPIDLSFSFPMIFAYNTIPDWSRERDAAALYRRTSVINFTHDFSASDYSGGVGDAVEEGAGGSKKGGSDYLNNRTFEQKVYGPIYCSRVIGAILAVGEALRQELKNGGSIPWSNELLSYREEDEKASGSAGASAYIAELRRFFPYFTSWKLLQADCNNYLKACQGWVPYTDAYGELRWHRGLGGVSDEGGGEEKVSKFASISELKIAARKYMSGRSRSKVTVGDTRINTYHFDRSIGADGPSGTTQFGDGVLSGEALLPRACGTRANGDRYTIEEWVMAGGSVLSALKGLSNNGTQFFGEDGIVTGNGTPEKV